MKRDDGKTERDFTRGEAKTPAEERNEEEDRTSRAQRQDETRSFTGLRVKPVLMSPPEV